MPGADRGGEPDHKRVPRIVGRESRGEHRRERRHRTVHQADQAGLDDLQDKPPALVLGFVAPGGVGQHSLLEAGGELVVLVLVLGEIAEQLADRRVGRAGQGLTVEARRGALHVVSVLARRFEAERLHLPNRLLRNIAADVLAAHERNVVAEFRHEEIDEPAPMRVLLGRHLVEHFGGRRVIVVQAVGEIGENARVLLLVADGEGQDLALGEIVEIAHGVSRTAPFRMFLKLRRLSGQWPRSSGNRLPAQKSAPGRRRPANLPCQRGRAGLDGKTRAALTVWRPPAL